MSHQGPDIIGLFEGYGGLTMAVGDALGGRLIAYSEIEPAACRLLEHHHPGVPNLGDITQVDWAAVERDFRRRLIVAGGFPCTDVSSAGRRAGLRPGTRSGLWTHMAYGIDQLRPDLVVIENVRGLTSADAACDVEPCPWCLGDDEGRPLRALGAVLGDLADLGYDARWHGLRAADVGAPHGRYRIFITAWPAASDTASIGRGEGRPEPARLLGGPDAPVGGALAAPDPDGVGPVRGGAARGRRPGSPDHDLPTADAVRDGREGHPERDLRQEAGQPTPLGRDAARRVLGTTGAGRRSAASDAASDGERQEHPSDDGFEGERSPVGRGAVEPAGAGRDRAAGDGRAASAPAGGRGDAGGNAPSHPVSWGDYEPAIRRWELILGRPAPAPTQTGQRGGQQLSPPFVEWMQGLPEGHVTAVPGLTRNEQLKLLGNGVVSQQAEAALRWLLATEAREAAA